MNDKAIFRLIHDEARQRALEAVKHAPEGHIVIVRPSTRTLEQNAKLWAMLADVAQQVVWEVDHQMVHIADMDWKDIFTAALRNHQRMARGILGGVVMLGEHTSRMTKAQFADLIEVIYAFGAEYGVCWRDAWVRR